MLGGGRLLAVSDPIPIPGSPPLLHTPLVAVASCDSPLWVLREAFGWAARAATSGGASGKRPCRSCFQDHSGPASLGGPCSGCYGARIHRASIPLRTSRAFSFEKASRDLESHFSLSSHRSAIRLLASEA